MKEHHARKEIGIEFVQGWLRVKVVLPPGRGRYWVKVVLQPGQEQQRAQGSTEQYFVKRNETEC
jgi:hypothetical protein